MAIKSKIILSLITVFFVLILSCEDSSDYNSFDFNACLPNPYSEQKRKLLLSPDNNLTDRAFASVVKFKDSYRVYYAGRNPYNRQYAIFMKYAKSLEDINDSFEIKLFDPIDANSTTQVWMPYVFQHKEDFFMVFTARSGNYKTNSYLENIKLASSSDGLIWDIIDKPILNPILEWEGLEVENWGLIKLNDNFYMNYESRGPTRSQDVRSIAFAKSKDLFEWKRLSSEPVLTKSEYCASFFKYRDSVYMIVPSNNVFRIYEAPNVESIKQNKFIGIWNPYGENNEFIYDSPEVITDDITKEIKENSKFEIAFSTYINGAWITEYITYQDMDQFLCSITRS